MRQEAVQFSVESGRILRNFRYMSKVMAKCDADDANIHGISRVLFVRRRTKIWRGLKNEFMRATIKEMVESACNQSKPKCPYMILASLRN